MKYTLYSIISLLALAAAVSGCRKWADHNKNLDPKAAKTLVEQINENPQLSRFAGLLVKSGIDKDINARAYTVFAPTNDALQTLDNAIETDTAQLRRFVNNHIAVQNYFVTAVTETRRIPMTSGKYHTLQGQQIDDAHITTADQYAKNGVLHVIDKPLLYVSNSWDFIASNPEMPVLQKTWLLNNYYKVFDATNAVQIGVDTLGRPVYANGTDSVLTNVFWNTVYDIRNESKLYTTFVLTDDAWTTESARLKPYYTDSLQRSYTALNMIQEYAMEGAYNAQQLPDTIVGRYNVKIAIDKGAIVKTIATSNGYVHIMNKMTVRLEDKFRTIVVEAENYDFTSASRAGNMYKRQMLDSTNGRRFTDLVAYNHGLPLFNVGYRITNVAGKQKYRAYWVAVNSGINNVTAAFTQKLGIDTATSVKFFGYTTVPLNTYSEQLIGEFTLPEYRQRMNIYLTAANTTTANTNALVCDYIKLVPVF